MDGGCRETPPERGCGGEGECCGVDGGGVERAGRRKDQLWRVDESPIGGEFVGK